MRQDTNIDLRVCDRQFRHSQSDMTSSPSGLLNIDGCKYLETEGQCGGMLGGSLPKLNSCTLADDQHGPLVVDFCQPADFGLLI